MPPTPSKQEMALIPFGLVALTIAHIVRRSTEGATLVFLPGLHEITKVQDILLSESPLLGVNFTNDSKYTIIPLHSSLPDAQAEVFDSVPQDCRKIILSTNIAETSVTISDVKYGTYIRW
jgi:ATP-dependent RNA helicase DHX36